MKKGLGLLACVAALQAAVLLALQGLAAGLCAGGGRFVTGQSREHCLPPASSHKTYPASEGWHLHDVRQGRGCAGQSCQGMHAPSAPRHLSVITQGTSTPCSKPLSPMMMLSHDLLLTWSCKAGAHLATGAGTRACEGALRARACMADLLTLMTPTGQGLAARLLALPVPLSTRQAAVLGPTVAAVFTCIPILRVQDSTACLAAMVEQGHACTQLLPQVICRHMVSTMGSHHALSKSPWA